MPFTSSVSSMSHDTWDTWRSLSINGTWKSLNLNGQLYLVKTYDLVFYNVDGNYHHYWFSVLLVTLSLPSNSPRPQDGITALMIASAQGHPSVVKTLIQAGATVNSAMQVDTLVVCEAQKVPVDSVASTCSCGCVSGPFKIIVLWMNMLNLLLQ